MNLSAMRVGIFFAFRNIFLNTFFFFNRYDCAFLYLNSYALFEWFFDMFVDDFWNFFVFGFSIVAVSFFHLNARSWINFPYLSIPHSHPFFSTMFLFFINTFLIFPRFHHSGVFWFTNSFVFSCANIFFDIITIWFMFCVSFADFLRFVMTFTLFVFCTFLFIYCFIFGGIMGFISFISATLRKCTAILRRW